MNTLIPTPDAIPVAWGYFQVLLMLVFPLHLMLMNAMLGSTAIAVYALLRKDETLRGLAYELGKVIPFLIAFAVNLGVAALLFLQVLYGHLFYSSSVLMGVYWLAVVPLLIIAYYAVYLFDFRFPFLAKPAAAALICLPLFIFLCIAFIYSNNMTLMLNPETWKGYLGNPGGTLLNLGDRALVPRYLHFIIGGTAVGGLFVALLGRVRKGMVQEVRSSAERIGMKVFTVLTGAQIVVGFLFLASLPRPILLLFMGGDMLATALLTLGLVSALILLVAGMARRVWLCVGMAVPQIFIMSFMRDFVRSGYLQPHFSPASLPVVPQYSPMVMFVVALVAGLAIIVWMLRKAVVSFGGQKTDG
ncbi:hypothetical protein EG829_02040 [bacterium]|nr:hypothetical protein [bacterium]